MRRAYAVLLLAGAGCAHVEYSPPRLEDNVAAVASLKAEPVVRPLDSVEKPIPDPDKPIDLAVLWDLTLTNNPRLRESSADVEAARGRLIQAGLYPNPRLVYRGDEVGLRDAPKGNQSVELLQEIVTAKKLQLDQAAAGRGVDAAGVALLGRKFEVLSRVRRLYYGYISLEYTLKAYDEVVAALEQSVETTRKLVESAKTRPRTDLLRLQALLEEARASKARMQTNLHATWEQLAAEVGFSRLAEPKRIDAIADIPDWPEELIRGRVQTTHTELRQLTLEIDQAQIEYERAKAEAVPNVTVGAGYIRSYVDGGAGANLTLETHLPLWDRKQGLIHERQARLYQLEAAYRTQVNRLTADTAEAYARYQGARAQADRLTNDIIPKLEESLRLLRTGYEAGATISFADVQLSLESLNDARLKLAASKQELWYAIADLQSLMQLDVNQKLKD